MERGCCTMLSERITALFALLQCTNTDIARFAGCSPSNISRLKSGLREPPASSRTVSLLAEGIYAYADYENLLPVLRELCGTEDSARERLIPGIVAWLYGTETLTPPPRAVVPRSRRARELRRQSFGEKLDRAMTLLGLSNAQLAALLSIDVSLASRYRSGVYSPHGNEQREEKLSGELLARAEKSGRTEELAALCRVKAEELDAGAVAEWLYGSAEDPALLAQFLLRSLDAFTPGQGGAAPAVPETAPVPAAERYWGTEGLRGAVVRFLIDAAREGGELLLYSDEPMDWMSGDRAFFTLWASLMAACVRNGVHIRIIHNVDRASNEMAAAISGWLPLYVSGMIEPYVFRKERNSRFCHTVFLRAGGACIHGFFPTGAGENRWYEYITDEARLRALKSEYGAMLSSAQPFLKTYAAAEDAAYRRFCEGRTGPRNYLLPALPVATMPEALLERMLQRAAVGEARTQTALAVHRALRLSFFDALRRGSVDLLFCPGAGEPRQSVNFALELMDLTLEYTREEYAAHVAAVAALVETEKNFHLTLLPHAPFRDIQIVTLGDAVAVLRCGAPYAAFVFLSPALTQSVSDYLSDLIRRNGTDRHTTVRALEALIAGGSGED